MIDKSARAPFNWVSLLATVVIGQLIWPAAVAGQSADNVAIVVNDHSAESQRIAEHYVRARGIPASNVLRIQTSTAESIARDAYVRTIEQPVGAAIRQAGLEDRLLYLVLTRGVPLRILGTEGLKGTAASVDSELTLLYRRLTGQSVATAGHIPNPYFLDKREVSEAQRFTHREHDIYLVTRLDAFTVDEALALVDRAQQPSAGGLVVLDQRVAATGPRSGDEWMERAAERIGHQGHRDRVLLEQTPLRATTKEPVLGFYSWGAADPEYRTRRHDLAFAAGAVVASLTSFDARTFREPPAGWQPSRAADKTQWFEGASDALIADLVRDGVTGIAGQVGEAYLLGAVRPDILFPAYLAGFNLAEAFYLATPALSWQQIVVGDPLATPFDRQRLTAQELEEAVDPATGLPGVFARRRLAAARDAGPGQPEDVVKAVVRAETLVARGDSAGARASLAKAIEATPTSINLLVMLADLEEKADNTDAAIARYRQILELDPTHVIGLNNLAYALAEKKNQPAEALPFARKAASLAPRLGAVLDTLGWVEHLLGNHSVAADIFREAVAREPNNAEIRVHAAVANAAAGRTEQARKDLDQAVKLDPGLADREDVRRLRTRLPGM